jgi:uncharacterized membrane protein
VTERRRSGSVLVILAVLGIATAGYLAAVKLSGELPVCGPLHGCETVALSTYSEVMGVPVAVIGVAYSVVALVASIVWWRSGERRALYLLYGMGLLGLLAVAYLTYLELFVIRAVCVWCVGYAVTVVGGWLVAVFTLRAAGADDAAPDGAGGTAE